MEVFQPKIKHTISRMLSLVLSCVMLLHLFDYHSGWMVSHMDGVNFECVRPLPFEKDCEPEEENPTEEIIAENPTHPVAVKPLHKQFFAPAGYVYESVASNRIEGATAKIYYEGDNGEPIPVTAVFTDAEVSPSDENVYYGRVLKLTRTDGLPFSGGGIEITVSAEAENYAGNALENAYASGALTAAQMVTFLYRLLAK